MSPVLLSFMQEIQKYHLPVNFSTGIDSTESFSLAGSYTIDERRRLRVVDFQP
jgi:hypothetical protein